MRIVNTNVLYLHEEDRINYLEIDGNPGHFDFLKEIQERIKLADIVLYRDRRLAKSTYKVLKLRY